MKKRRLLIMLLSAALSCTGALYAAGNAAVKGNPKSKVYHMPVCAHYSAKGSSVEFKSEVDAQKAGYKACKQCAKSKGAPKSADKK